MLRETCSRDPSEAFAAGTSRDGAGAATVSLGRLEAIKEPVRATLPRCFRGTTGCCTTGRDRGGRAAIARARVSTGSLVASATVGASIDTGSKNSVYSRLIATRHPARTATRMIGSLIGYAVLTTRRARPPRCSSATFAHCTCGRSLAPGETTLKHSPANSSPASSSLGSVSSGITRRSGSPRPECCAISSRPMACALMATVDPMQSVARSNARFVARASLQARGGRCIIAQQVPVGSRAICTSSPTLAYGVPRRSVIAKAVAVALEGHEFGQDLGREALPLSAPVGQQ